MTVEPPLPEPDDPSGAPPADSARSRGVRRSNGLDAAAFVPLVDLDPRVTTAVLAALERVGVAAYVVPVAGSVGGYLEVRLPDRPTDRLWVDQQQTDAARVTVGAELADLAALLSVDDPD